MRWPFTETEAPVAHAGIRKLNVKSLACEVFKSNCTTLSKGYELFCVNATSAPSCFHRSVDAIYKFTHTPIWPQLEDSPL